MKFQYAYCYTCENKDSASAWKGENTIRHQNLRHVITYMYEMHTSKSISPTFMHLTRSSIILLN